MSGLQVKPKVRRKVSWLILSWNVYSVIEKSDKNNNLTLITTKLKYTFDLNSLPLSSSPVSLMNSLNVQNYNALEKLDKD